MFTQHNLSQQTYLRDQALRMPFPGSRPGRCGLVPVAFSSWGLLDDVRTLLVSSKKVVQHPTTRTYPPSPYPFSCLYVTLQASFNLRMARVSFHSKSLDKTKIIHVPHVWHVCSCSCASLPSRPFTPFLLRISIQITPCPVPFYIYNKSLGESNGTMSHA